MSRLAKIAALVAAGVMLSGCGSDPISADRYVRPDALYEQLRANVVDARNLSVVAEIDHSRLAAELDAHMPPARALIFAAPAVEIALLEMNPLVGVDLPLRVLAYEESPEGGARVIYNDYDYLASRYDLPPSGSGRQLFEAAMDVVLAGIERHQVAEFDQSTMQPDGIVTMPSSHDFDRTLARVLEAIGSQDDAVLFETVTLPSPESRAQMILFGAPAPGARAMRAAPTLGLDGFCQKFLVWEDSNGTVRLSFNDLGALANRQGVGNSIALRVIDYRLGSTFSPALSQ